MVIRLMNENDIAEVIKIENEIFSLPWKKDDFLRSIKNQANIYLVVELEEAIVGYCGLWGIVDEGHINNVAVAKEHQNKGIAYKMLKKLIEEGIIQGLKYFTLEVRASNKAAIHLYEKLGFKTVGIRPNFYNAPKEDGIIMWR